MTGLENILNEIKKDSEAEAEKIIKNAEAKAEEIIAKARKDGEVLYKNILEEAKKQAAIIEERGDSAAKLLQKRAALKKKQELIKEYITLAKEKLEALSGEDALTLYKKIIEKYASGEKGELLLEKSVKEAVSPDFEEFLKTKNLEISDKELKGQKGLIIVYGSIEENCTFDAMFDGMTEELSDKTMALLFE